MIKPMQPRKNVPLQNPALTSSITVALPRQGLVSECGAFD
jgi:hypothetical protein